MFYWIYDIPAVATVGAFAALFVAVCWLGTIFSRAFVQSRFHTSPGSTRYWAIFYSISE